MNYSGIHIQIGGLLSELVDNQRGRLDIAKSSAGSLQPSTPR